MIRQKQRKSRYVVLPDHLDKFWNIAKLICNFLKIEINLKAEILTDDKEWLNVSKKLKT